MMLLLRSKKFVSVNFDCVNCVNKREGERERSERERESIYLKINLTVFCSMLLRTFKQMEIIIILILYNIL